MTRFTISLALALLLASSLALALPRDRTELHAFKRMNPCPVTGKSTGACKGWEVDHRVPLKCGGADKPANMQWLSVREHKKKTKRESSRCRGK